MAQQISESELVLMKIIWKNGESALYSFIMDELEKDKNEWKSSTVLTLLSRLGEKKFLKVKKIGRKNEYVAMITETEYQTMQTHSFLDKVYFFHIRLKTIRIILLHRAILKPSPIKIAPIPASISYCIRKSNGAS